ncbi:hypothetical protein BC831DRAFT_482326 [Entophlyctis helioformis]|nr:hypothetical protein BC831DRAFT_482326 [Entophlyctis helioformis]
MAPPICNDLHSPADTLVPTAGIPTLMPTLTRSCPHGLAASTPAAMQPTRRNLLPPPPSARTSGIVDVHRAGIVAEGWLREERRQQQQRPRKTLQTDTAAVCAAGGAASGSMTGRLGRHDVMQLAGMLRRRLRAALPRTLPTHTATSTLAPTPAPTSTLATHRVPINTCGFDPEQQDEQAPPPPPGPMQSPSGSSIIDRPAIQPVCTPWTLSEHYGMHTSTSASASAQAMLSISNLAS